MEFTTGIISVHYVHAMSAAKQARRGKADKSGGLAITGYYLSKRKARLK
jgi:hypothetical protein